MISGEGEKEFRFARKKRKGEALFIRVAIAEIFTQRREEKEGIFCGGVRARELARLIPGAFREDSSLSGRERREINPKGGEKKLMFAGPHPRLAACRNSGPAGGGGEKKRTRKSKRAPVHFENSLVSINDMRRFPERGGEEKKNALAKRRDLKRLP